MQYAKFDRRLHLVMHLFYHGSMCLFGLDMELKLRISSVSSMSFCDCSQLVIFVGLVGKAKVLPLTPRPQEFTYLFVQAF